MDSQRAATPASCSPSFGGNCSSHDGVRVSAVGMDSLEPAGQGQTQDPPALPCAHLRGDSQHRK